MMKQMMMVIALVAGSVGHAAVVAPDAATLERAIATLNSDYRVTRNSVYRNVGMAAGIELYKLGALLVGLDATLRLVNTPGGKLAPWAPLRPLATGRVTQVGVGVILYGSMLMAGGVIFEGIRLVRHRPSADERTRAELKHFFSLSPRRQFEIARDNPELAVVLVRMADIMTGQSTPGLVLPANVAPAG